MIIQPQESYMPEPYRTYVRQRSEVIAAVLGKVVGDRNVELCTEAFTPDKSVFHGPDDIVYGVVVKNYVDGLKSVLYSGYFTGQPEGAGIATTNQGTALRYALSEFRKGNRVRVKDPLESDGNGQRTVETVSEAREAISDISSKHGCGAVLMPHLDTIIDRISVGEIHLGGENNFGYIGREEATTHEGREVYGGTMMALSHGSYNYIEAKNKLLDIPPRLAMLGVIACIDYYRIALSIGRVSFDVVDGVTDNGTRLQSVIDVTPRVGGATPAEVLAIEEIYRSRGAICIAASKLIYDPQERPITGTNFVDTASLVINAQVLEVLR